MSHITVERNRRRQMNDHLKVLRSLTPCFYIKRGDQASIIGGVIEFIKELQQLVQSLESKKRRRTLSPSPLSSPTFPPHDPQHQHLIDPLSSGHAYTYTEINNNTSFKEMGTCCNSPSADVEAKISGSNVILRVVSRRIRGQLVKITTVLENLSFQVLHLNISSMEDTVLYLFVVKIGLECHLSLEELAVEVQKSFFSDVVSSAV